MICTAMFSWKVKREGGVGKHTSPQKSPTWPARLRVRLKHPTSQPAGECRDMGFDQKAAWWSKENAARLCLISQSYTRRRLCSRFTGYKLTYNGEQTAAAAMWQRGACIFRPKKVCKVSIMQQQYYAFKWYRTKSCSKRWVTLMLPDDHAQTKGKGANTLERFWPKCLNLCACKH